jgi:hypothetical protein
MKKRFDEEQVIRILREADVPEGVGARCGTDIRLLGVLDEHTRSAWQNGFVESLNGKLRVRSEAISSIEKPSLVADAFISS